MNISLTSYHSISKPEEMILSNNSYLSFKTPEVNIYFEAKTLNEIEEALAKALANELLLKKTLCILLSKIKLEELYREIMLSSFKDYLKTRRLEIAYSTAVEYAKIGEMLVRYHDKLIDISFNEVDGLKKLLLLEKALKDNKAEEVFSHLKSDSLKEFCKYVKNARAFSLVKSNGGAEEQKHKKSKHKVFEENDKLFLSMEADKHELLTFNRQYFESEGVEGEYEKYKEVIMEITIKYFMKLKKS